MNKLLRYITQVSSLLRNTPQLATRIKTARASDSRIRRMPFSSSSDEEESALRCSRRLYGIPASPPKPLPVHTKKKKTKITDPVQPTTSESESATVFENPFQNIDIDIFSNSAQSCSLSKKKMPSNFGVTDLKFEISDDWQVFIERLELMFISQSVEKEKQVPELLTRVSAETYSILRDLSIPKKPSELKFDEIVKLIEKHLKPPPSELARRHEFVTVKQTANETISDFVARLKRASRDCNFTDLNTALRDQFVHGLINHKTRVELFRKESLTFAEAVKIAEDWASAVRHAKGVDKNSGKDTTSGSSKSTEAEVNYASSSKSKFPGRRSNNSYRDGNRSNQSYQQRSTLHHQRMNFNDTSKGTQPASHRSNDQQRQGQRTRHRSKQDQPSRASSTSYQQSKVICYCCNEPNHLAKFCVFRFNTCNYCKRKGHIEKACRKKSNVNMIESNPNNSEEIDENSDSDFFFIDDNSVKFLEESKPMFLEIKIGKSKLNMEIDTGTYVTIISEKTKNEFFPNLTMHPPDTNLMSYSKDRMKCLGMLTDVKVEFNKRDYVLKLYVMPGTGVNLIGRQWLSKFNLWPLKLPNSQEQTINNLTTNSIAEHFKFMFPNFFSNTPGNFNGRQIKLIFKENTVPVQLKPYRVPLSLTEKVKEEINRLLKLGFLEPVTTSMWATPVIPVLKSDGSIRICGNFKLTVNPFLVVKRQPMPTKQEIFAKLQVGKKWSQIDLSHAFMQFSVDHESRDALTIITSEGLFRYTKLPEGISSSPGECQETLCKLVKHIPHTMVYIDNIYCTGKTDEEHLSIIEQILKALDDANLRGNWKKCDLFKNSLDLLGYCLNQEGLHPSPNRVEAIKKMEAPTTLKGIRSLLGIINYYEEFLPHRAENLKPLYNVIKSEKFHWDNNCEKAFEWMKSEISNNVLQLYDPNKTLVLACDASYYGLSAILSQKDTNNVEKPIAFGSKKIPEVELHRAILDKEAAAIVFGFKKYYQFLYGNFVILKTDHEPLKFIFGVHKAKSLTYITKQIATLVLFSF